MDNNNLLEVLIDLIPDLKPAFKKIAEYIISNKSLIEKITITDLAKECGISTASITRFIQTLGYHNFQHFKVQFSKNLIKKSAENFQPQKASSVLNIINPGDSPKEIIDKIQSAYISTIIRTFENINIDDVTKAANIIDSSNSLTIFAVGNSYVAGQHAQKRFYRIKKNINLYADPVEMGVSATTASEGDVFLALCYSGKIFFYEKALQAAQKHGAKIISITGPNPIIPIIKNPDVHFTYYNLENDINDIYQISTSSRISQIGIIDIIYAILDLMNCEANHTKIKESSFLTSTILKNKDIYL